VDLGTVGSGVVGGVEVVGFGRPATAALARRIAAAKGAAGAHPLDPVTVIVPSNTAGLSARRLLATGDPVGGLAPVNLANVDFVTPFRLAELLGSPHMGDRRPLTNPVLAAAVRAVLASTPGLFAGVADHQATAAAVVGVYAELSRARPETRAAIAAASSRGAEVVRVVEAVRAALAGFYDENDLARVAAAYAGSGGAVLWYLPDRLSPAMEAMVAVVLAEADPSRSGVIVGITGDDEVDGPVLDLVRRCGCEVDGAPTSTTETSTSTDGPPVATRIVSVSDPDDEVRQVVREIVHLAATGTPLDRIAVFRPTPSAYARTLLEQLDGAGIPHNGPGAARLADTVAGRTLLGALGLPHQRWGRGAVIALVAEAPVRAEGHLASPRRWDALSRQAGVVGGLDDWRTKLAARLAKLEVTVADASAAEAAGEPSAVPRRIAAQREAETATRMAGFVETLAAWLDAVDAAPSWQGKSDAARALLHGLLGQEQRRVSWPEIEVAAAQRVDEALVRLAALDDLEGGPSRTTFELAVAAELDEPVGRVGRFGSGVLVAPLGTSVGTDVEAVFVLGLAEGTLPAQRRDPALLPESDRELAASDELPTQDVRLLDQRRAYLAALAGGREHRVVLFPRGDLRGRRGRLPSRWLLESASAKAGRRVSSRELATLSSDIVEVVASYADGVARAVAHGALAERDVAALLGSPDPEGHPLATGAIGRGFTARSARAGAAFTEWDGNLAGHAVASPATGTPLSPSRLETWATCPFRYFLQSVLRLGERDDPERIVEITAADRGTLVHAVLERFIGEVLARPAAAQPAPTEPWSTADRARVAAIAEEEFVAVEAKGLSGRPLHWRRTKADVLADLDEFLTRDDAHRAGAGLRPARVELAFGMGDAEPLTIPLRDGVRSLTFRGKIDRVDVDGDGRPVVLDYKTGKGKDDDELQLDPVREGRTLQLGIYAEAAKAELEVDEVEAYYWMISGRGGWAKPGYAWTEERRQRFLDVAEAIVDGIESGVFPALPGEYDSFFGSHENCGFCEFNRVCPRDREDHQRAMADAPELSVLERLQLRVEATEAAS
jgi:RecB family exonuclease